MDKVNDKLSYPNTLFVELTNYCNIECFICPHSKIKRKKGYMEFDTLRTIIEQSVGKAKVCYLQGFGESLLHKELFSMIAYVNSKDMDVYLSTNSLALDEETVHRLLNSGLSRLYLPLSSMDREKYEFLRTGARLSIVMDNIDRCIEIRKGYPASKTQIMMTPIMMQETVTDVYEVRDKYEPLLKGIGRVGIKGYCHYGHAVPDKSVPGFQSPPGFCTMMNYAMMIYWNGDVSTCCNDYDGFMTVGNVLYDSIEEIWNSDLYNEYRKLESDFCKRCLNG